VPWVNEVAISEAPNGVPGEIKISVAYSNDDPEARRLVAERIEQLRPAGIRVIPDEAARKRVHVQVQLTLAGAGVSGADLTAVSSGVEDRLAGYLASVPPGGAVRQARLSSLALQDPRIADASIQLLGDGEPPAEELTLPPGQVLDVVRPFTFNPPRAEQVAAAAAITSRVTASLPIHLVAGVTLADASQAVNLAVNSHLSSRRPDAPLTFDSLAAAIRDDSRFALIRDQAVVTIETADHRFRQLTDGVGTYAPAPNETLQKGAVDLQPREGAV
jgi:hypothetical protein